MPILNRSPLWGIILLTFLVSILSILAYKYLTNQVEMKHLKEKQKEFQERMKALKGNTEELMRIQKEAMKVNLDYMRHSFKATLFTLIPLLVIFGWMNGHLMYEPIYPGEKYSLTVEFNDDISGKAELKVDESTDLLSPAVQVVNQTDQSKEKASLTWNLKSKEGEHSFIIKTPSGEEQAKKVLITKELRYEEPLSLYQHSEISQATIVQNRLHPLGELALFGWYPGWLGLYIIFSIAFSMGLRKVFNVY